MNMKTIWIILPLVLVSLCMISCGDDDEGGTREDPVTTADPEGTIVANLTNDLHYINFKPYSGLLGMNSANNLRTDQMEIVSVGNVKGLSSITKIPENGWTNTTAAIPGYGYILRSEVKWDEASQKHLYMYVRVYVVDYMKSTSGGIMGCTIKYHFWKSDSD